MKAPTSVVGFMVDGMCKTSLGIVLKPLMAIFGMKDQAERIQEAFKSGDPVEITVSIVEMFCMLFGLTSQCFTGDTLVSTEDGLRPIEDIQAGDYVWSENTGTGEKELKKVLSVSVTETDQLVHVTTQTGTVINTTENHPFYTEGKGWCVASELEEGDVLRTQDGKTETVASVEIETLDEPVKVYNLEIEDSHTYYVSVDGVLVHNGCGDSNYDDYVTSERVGKSKGDTPRDNKRQNKQIDKIAKMLNLSKDDRRELHDLISGQGYGFQKILEIAKDFFGRD